jgi:hypothetical protein
MRSKPPRKLSSWLLLTGSPKFVVRGATPLSVCSANTTPEVNNDKPRAAVIESFFIRIIFSN